MFLVEASVTLGGCHEHCVKAIGNKLPPLLQTLPELYESTGVGGAYGIYFILAY